MGTVVDLLAGMPPANWRRTLERIDVIRSYRALSAPTGKDVAEHADRLGLDARSFYRLIRAHEELERGIVPRPSMRGRRRYLTPEAETIIDGVMSELGREVPDRILRLEVARRCAEASVPAPSANALRVRSAPSPVDLRIRLRRRFDFVIDACPLDLDVLVDAGGDQGASPAVAWLVALLRGDDGAICAHVLTAGEPTSDDLVDMMSAATPVDAGVAMLAATGDIAETLGPAGARITSTGLRLDVSASLGLRPGVAVAPVLGLRLGRLTLQPRRREPFEGDVAVPIGLARRIVIRLLEDRLG